MKGNGIDKSALKGDDVGYNQAHYVSDVVVRFSSGVLLVDTPRFLPYPSDSAFAHLRIDCL